MDGFDAEGVRVWEGVARDEEGADGGGSVEACGAQRGGFLLGFPVNGVEGASCG